MNHHFPALFLGATAPGTVAPPGPFCRRAAGRSRPGSGAAPFRRGRPGARWCPAGEAEMEVISMGKSIGNDRKTIGFNGEIHRKWKLHEKNGHFTWFNLDKP